MSFTDVTASMVHVHWPSMMLGQRSRRWPNIGSTLVQHAVFLIGTLLILVNSEMEIQRQPSRHKTSNQCWFNFGPPSTTLVQR